MSTADIVTGQFVHISQSVAGVGDRIVARLIDYALLFAYSLGSYYFYMKFFNYNAGIPEAVSVIVFFVIILPVIFYSFLCEAFNNGQSVGKRVMHLRVVCADGSQPTMGALFLRWILQLVDVWFYGLGILFIAFSRHHQRIGDIAAGTLVINTEGYKKVDIPLSYFDYAREDYRPHYPGAARLSSGQAEVIARAIEGAMLNPKSQGARLEVLARKVSNVIGAQPQTPDVRSFLETVLHDYEHYAAEIV